MPSSSGLQLYMELSAALVIISHKCIIVTKKLHKIPYHMVNHWNEATNIFYPINFLFGTALMFTVGLCTVSIQGKQEQTFIEFTLN